MTDDEKTQITVERWIAYDDSHDKFSSFGGMGGFFDNGMRWGDYLEAWSPNVHPYAEAVRKAVVERQLKRGGDWHQNSEDGVPFFSDGTVATFSYRAWGDLLAAIWAQEEDKDYCYMDFYMDACGRVLGEDEPQPRTPAGMEE